MEVLFIDNNNGVYIFPYSYVSFYIDNYNKIPESKCNSFKLEHYEVYNPTIIVLYNPSMYAKNIIKNKGIKHIIIMNVTNINPNFFRNLYVEKLRLCALNNYSIFSHLHNLVELTIEISNIIPLYNMNFLRSLKKLTIISKIHFNLNDINNHNIEHLNLSKSTNCDLEGITNFKNLKSLEINGERQLNDKVPLTLELLQINGLLKMDESILRYKHIPKVVLYLCCVDENIKMDNIIKTSCYSI